MYHGRNNSQFVFMLVVYHIDYWQLTSERWISRELFCFCYLVIL